jgi:2-iminobutanoate/2-iminopropanoate deaminase
MATTTYGPYSPVKKAGSFYFVAGQVGVDAETKTAPSAVAAQTHQALKNLEVVLKAVGLRLHDVVKTSIFLKDMCDFAAVNQVYVAYFNEPRPARSCVAVVELPRIIAGTDLLVEIEAIAHKGNKQ